MSLLPPDFHFSQRSLQDYVDCRRRFQLRYLQHLAWPAVEAKASAGLRFMKSFSPLTIQIGQSRRPSLAEKSTPTRGSKTSATTSAEIPPSST